MTPSADLGLSPALSKWRKETLSLDDTGAQINRLHQLMTAVTKGMDNPSAMVMGVAQAMEEEGDQ